MADALPDLTAYDAVLFDLDNTLVATNKLDRIALSFAAAHAASLLADTADNNTAIAPIDEAQLAVPLEA